MEKKYILCDTPKGKFEIPLKAVAENRAEYYMGVDGFEKGSPEWQEEVDYVMNDDFEGIDWLVNNSNWEDWSEVAVKVSDEVTVLENDFWCSSEHFEIIEK